MPEVLVLVDHADGAIRKTTTEMLTLAARLGEPSAVFIGADPAPGLETLGRFGARTVYVVDPGQITDYLVAPVAEVLAQLASTSSASAVLISSTTHGKEIAGRLATKTDSGIITDAVDVRLQDGQVATTQSVFAGSYTVDSVVARGPAVITVKPNSCAPQENPAPAAVQQVSFEASEQARAARIVERREKQASGRPELTEAAIVVSGGRGTGGTSPRSRPSPMCSVRPSGPRARRWTPAGTRTRVRSARPASRCRRSCMWLAAFPGLFSTAPECRRRRRSSPSTRTKKRLFSSSLISASSGIFSRFSRKRRRPWRDCAPTERGPRRRPAGARVSSREGA